jgi:hypothetical protein
MYVQLQRPTSLKLSILLWIICCSILTIQGCTCTKNPSHTASGDETDQPSRGVPFYELKLTSPSKLEGEQREIKIAVTNQGQELGKPNLICTRQEGKTAQPSYENKPLQEQTPGKYVIELPAIAPGTTLNYTLTFNPQTDERVKWVIELPNNQPTAGPIQVTWEKTTFSVMLKNLKWDPTTGKFMCEVLNTSSQPVRNIQFSVKTEHDIPLPPVDPIKELEPYEKKVVCLADVKLAIKKSITLIVTSSYEQNGATTILPPISKTLTREPMRVELEISDLKEQSEDGKFYVQATIYPEDEQADISKLYLQYQNTDSKATLNGCVKGEVSFQPSTTTSTTKGKLEFDFVDADKATFNFLLVEAYEEDGVKKYFTLQSIHKTFIKEISFSFYKLPKHDPINPIPEEPTHPNSYSVYGDSLITIYIKQFGGNEKDTENLKLLIKPEKEDDVEVFVESDDKKAIREISGQDLAKYISRNRKKREKDLNLFIKPKKDDVPAAKVNLELTYQGKQMECITIHWKPEVLSIEVPNNYVVGDEKYFFYIHSSKKPGSVFDPEDSEDWSSYKVKIESNSEDIRTQFLLKKQNSPYEESSTKASEATPVHTLIQDFFSQKAIFYKVEPNIFSDSKKATLTIILTKNGKAKGDIELDRKTVTWVKKTVGLAIYHGPYADHMLTDKQGFKINVKSIVDKELDLSKFEVQITNPKDLNLIFGKCSGKQINAELKEIIGKEKLLPGEEQELTLQLDSRNTSSALHLQDMAFIRVSFKDKENDIVLKVFNLLYKPSLKQEQDLLELDKSYKRNLIKCLRYLNELKEIYEVYQKKIQEFHQFIPSEDQGPTSENYLRVVQLGIDYSLKYDIPNMIGEVQKQLNSEKESITYLEPLVKPENLRVKVEAGELRLVFIDNRNRQEFIQKCKDVVNSIKTLLDESGITNMSPDKEDLPIVQEFKKLHQEAEEKLSTLIPLAQDRLNSFAQNLNEKTKKAIDEKDVQEFLEVIEKQKGFVKALLCKTGDFLHTMVLLKSTDETKGKDFIPKDWWEQFLATNYQYWMKNLVSGFDLQKDQGKLNIAKELVQASQRTGGFVDELITQFLVGGKEVVSPGIKKSIQKATIEAAIGVCERLASQQQVEEIEAGGTKLRDQINQLRQQLGKL